MERIDGFYLSANITIGTIGTLATFYLPPLLQTFRRAHPGITIALQAGNEGPIVQAVKEGQADLGLILDVVSSDPELESLLKTERVLLPYRLQQSPVTSSRISEQRYSSCAYAKENDSPGYGDRTVKHSRRKANACRRCRTQCRSREEGHTMAGEDQERLADYLELELFLAGLQAGKPVRFPEQATPEQLRIYHMALLFHTATPEAGEPRRAFAARLWVQLEEALPPLHQEHRSLSPARKTRTNRRLSRRLLFVGGTTAASAIVGAGGTWLLEHMNQHNNNPHTGSPLMWVVVTTMDELGNGAVRFIEAELIGYVVHTASHPGNIRRILAFSAACPHMGCLVQWASTDRTFRCPCHEAIFTETGEVDPKASSWHSLKPLTRLEVHVETDGRIAVRMPAE